jgi:hypothetical protein
MRYLFVLLLLAGCSSSKWVKEGHTKADLDRDYNECVEDKNKHVITSAVFGAFGVIGVFAGNTTKDAKIRDCLEERGWKREI